MRNVPQLQLICSLLNERPSGSMVRIASIGCSTGAELYSALWVIRSARPDLTVVAVGVDLSEAVVEAARAGRYRPGVAAAKAALFPAGMPELPPQCASWPPDLFVQDGECLRVCGWVREGTVWRVGDAADPGLLRQLGQQHIVLANNFLGPLADHDAEACLRNLAKLTMSGGYLVVDGVDLGLKSRVMEQLELVPVCERIEEIHQADPTKRDWPWTRWSHEPLDRDRADWRTRYSTVFRAPSLARRNPASLAATSPRRRTATPEQAQQHGARSA